jgi:hypothetical protein
MFCSNKYVLHRGKFHVPQRVTGLDTNTQALPLLWPQDMHGKLPISTSQKFNATALYKFFGTSMAAQPQPWHTTPPCKLAHWDQNKVGGL